MKTPVFVSFCLMIVAALVSLHALNKDSFSNDHLWKKEITELQKEKQNADLRTQLVQSELADYQQQVATLLPAAIKDKGAAGAFPLRQLASVARPRTDMLDIERASGVFESAKAAFREKDFEESSSLFAKLVDRYPSSAHVAEAQFLLAESQFQLKDYKASAAAIETMVDVYPENELTGFALMRLGKIFEAQNRVEDASDIYRAVIANFKQAELVKQANQSLKAVEL